MALKTALVQLSSLSEPDPQHGWNEVARVYLECMIYGPNRSHTSGGRMCRPLVPVSGCNSCFCCSCKTWISLATQVVERVERESMEAMGLAYDGWARADPTRVKRKRQDEMHEHTTIMEPNAARLVRQHDRWRKDSYGSSFAHAHLPTHTKGLCRSPTPTSAHAYAHTHTHTHTHTQVFCRSRAT